MYLVSVFYSSGPDQETEGFCEHIAVFAEPGEAREWLLESGYTPADSRRLKKDRGWLWNEPDGGLGRVELEHIPRR